MTTSVYQSSPDLTIKEHRIELKRGARRFAFEFGSITPRCWYAHNVLTGARTGAPSLTAVMTWTEQEADRMAREPEDPDPTPTAPASVPLLCAWNPITPPYRRDMNAIKAASRRARVRWAIQHPRHFTSGTVICLPAPKPLTLIEDVQTLIRSIHQWDGGTRYLSTRNDLWVSRGSQGDIYLYQTKPGKYTPPERLGVVGWLGSDGYTPAPKDRIERALKAVA